MKITTYINAIEDRQTVTCMSETIIAGQVFGLAILPTGPGRYALHDFRTGLRLLSFRSLKRKPDRIAADGMADWDARLGNLAYQTRQQLADRLLSAESIN